MIGFWLAAAVLTALTVLFLLRPLLRPRDVEGAAADFARRVYADQVAEIDRDRARGLLTPDQARAARAEIGRRLLNAAAEAEHVDGGLSSSPSRKLALALTAALPLGALAIYVPLGRPDLPAQPIAARSDRPQIPAEVLKAAASLARTLEENPDDLQGWTLLAATYAAMGRHADSADAYRRAMGLSQGDPELVSAYAEQLVAGAGGRVEDAARQAFEAALTADPANMRARFYLGLAHRQAGDLQGALAQWAALLKESPANAPWVPRVTSLAREAAADLGLDPATAVPAARLPAQPPASAPSLSPEQMQAMAGKTPEEQQAIIQGMVDSLAARLEAEPGDADGWLRLARAQQVLGRPEAARQALRRAAEAAPGRADIWQSYAQSLTPADNVPPSPEFLQALRKVRSFDPDNRQALWYLGLEAARSGHVETARDLLGRLLSLLPAEAPERKDVEARLRAIEKR